MLTRISGYTSVFGNEDSDGDIIVPGAFSKFLKNPDNQTKPMFFGHKNVTGPWAIPIGVTTLMREDHKGLYFEGFLTDGHEAQEVISLIKMGATIDSSFTYSEIDVDGQFLKELELHEISVVTKGANNLAYVELGEVITDEEELNVSDMLYEKAHARHLKAVTKSEALVEVTKTLDEAIEHLQKKVNHKKDGISIAIERIKQNTLLRK